MCAGTALTVHMAAGVNRELQVLGHAYIESYAALARANIRSLERALYIRRLYINVRDGEGRAGSDELRRLADEAGAAGAREMAAARAAIRAEIDGGSSLRDPVALSRLDTLLEVLEERRADVAQRQTALIEALTTAADPPSLRSLLTALDTEREDYDRQVEEARRELNRIVTAAADAAQASQANVVRAVVVITGLAGLLGLLVAGGFSRGLSRPVRRLLAGTSAVQDGKLDTVVPVTSRDEIGLLTRAFNAMVADLQAQVADQGHLRQVCRPAHRRGPGRPARAGLRRRRAARHDHPVLRHEGLDRAGRFHHALGPGRDHQPLLHRDVDPGAPA